MEKVYLMYAVYDGKTVIEKQRTATIIGQRQNSVVVKYIDNSGQEVIKEVNQYSKTPYLVKF